MSSKLKENVGIVQTLNRIMDDDSTIIVELSLFTSNMKKEFCGVFNFFLSFKKIYEKRKTHNMLSLMLDS